MKFRSDVAGQVTGVRFYKGSGNTGTHIGNLWSSTGTLLASATFTGESASGWQQVNVLLAGVDRGEHDLRRVVLRARTAATPRPRRRPRSPASTTRRCTRSRAGTVDGRNGVYRYGATGGVPGPHVPVRQLLRRRGPSRQRRRRRPTRRRRRSPRRHRRTARAGSRRHTPDGDHDFAGERRRTGVSTSVAPSDVLGGRPGGDGRVHVGGGRRRWRGRRRTTRARTRRRSRRRPRWPPARRTPRRSAA